MDSIFSLIHSPHHRKMIDIAAAAQVVEVAEKTIAGLAPHLTAFVRSVSLKNGILTLHATSPAACTEVYMLAHALIKAINLKIGSEVVSKIRALPRRSE